MTLDEKEARLRSMETLRDPEKPSKEWFMYVPENFNDALDIKQTERKVDGKAVLVWTQGSSFSFRAGDVLYDTEEAYKTWAEALAKIKLCLQVRSAREASAAQTRKDLDNGKVEKKDRDPGVVEFDVMVPNPSKTNLIYQETLSLSQDAFVKLLITGFGIPRSPLLLTL